MINPFLEKILFPSGDALLKTAFIGTLKHWRKVSHLNAECLAALQAKNLKDLLLYVSKNNRYYKKFLPDTETIGKSDPYELLQSLPILNKEIILNNKSLLISDSFIKNFHLLILEKSSGSSGIQGSVYMTRREAFDASAAQTHLWEWSGYKLGNRFLQLGMTPDRGFIKSSKDYFSRTVYKPAFKIDKNDVRSTLAKFQTKPGAYFGGYASGLYAYACIAEECNLHVTFKSVISWGDKMFPHYRKKIESVFNTRVYDTYGCTEGIIVGGQCEAGNFHILTPHVFLELLDDNNRPVAPGKIGNVVVTRLDARSFPLIRYKLGDLAIKSDTQDECKCGRHYPQLSMIVGRETDIVFTPKGNPLIVHFFTGIFEHEELIKQFRVTQFENSKILIEFITDTDDHAQILESLTAKMNQLSGETLPLSFRRVNYIPSTKSGKPQIVQSLIKKNEVIGLHEPANITTNLTRTS